jgi:hypothetical protein
MGGCCEDSRPAAAITDGPPDETTRAVSQRVKWIIQNMRKAPGLRDLHP